MLLFVEPKMIYGREKETPHPVITLQVFLCISLGISGANLINTCQLVNHFRKIISPKNFRLVRITNTFEMFDFVIKKTTPVIRVTFINWICPWANLYLYFTSLQGQVEAVPGMGVGPRNVERRETLTKSRSFEVDKNASPVQNDTLLFRLFYFLT